MKKLKTLLLLLPLLLCQCDLLKIGDNEPKLPPITMTGENTFGAIINGKIWLPGNPISFGAVLQKSDLLSIFADKDNGKVDENFSLVINGEEIDTRVYSFERDIYTDRIIEWQNDVTGCVYLKDDPEVDSSGILEILKLDRVNRVISGTFSFQFTKSGCPTVSVEQDRFDLKYID